MQHGLAAPASFARLAAEPDVLIKAVVIGDSGVGKSSLLFRYVDGEWNPSYIATIGVDFRVEAFERDGKVVRLQLWDTAGQERFRTITTSYFRGAHVVMVVFDVTDRFSFDNVCMWFRELAEKGVEDVPTVLVANKTDLTSLRVVSSEEGEQLAESLGATYVETSAKTAQNVGEAFDAMVDACWSRRLARLADPEESSRGRPRFQLPKGETVRHQSCFSRFAKAIGWL